jgi:hypothetical protein
MAAGAKAAALEAFETRSRAASRTPRTLPANAVRAQAPPRLSP